MTNGASRDRQARDSEPTVEEILGSIKRIIAENDAAPPPPKRRAARERQAEDILELNDEMVADTGEEGSDRDNEAETIVTAEAARSVRHSLTALAAMSEPGAPPQIVRSGETSIESLVREMLRPMLKNWLDDNLPDLVEQAVAREIRRIAGERGKK